MQDIDNKPVIHPIPIATARPKAEPTRENSTNSATSAGTQYRADEDETDGLTPEERAATDAFSANSATSAGIQYRDHPVPEDSILASYRDFARGVSEMPDGWLVAPILALCGRLLTPKVWLDFAGRKPLTIYNFVTGPAGLRKSTTFKPAQAIASRILTPSDWANGAASDSALFDTFEKQPHRLCFEDEANTILRTWQTAAYGKEVSARFLKLYDGDSWHQNFRRGKEDGGEAERTIPHATLSMAFGCTFGAANMHGLDAASGLRRRFGYYTATAPARKLYWPASLDGAEVDFHAERFAKLATLEGVITHLNGEQFSRSALSLWEKIQDRNRERCAAIEGCTSADESLAASLNESPARVLKLAAIFGACRWAAGSQVNPLEITPGNLELAEAHQNACLDALGELETVGRRVQISDEAEAVLAVIISGAQATEVGQPEILRTKSQLTSRFAANPGRAGAMTTARLYREIIASLIRKGKARIAEHSGKRVVYAFKNEEAAVKG